MIMEKKNMAEKTVEQTFEELDDILRRLESGEISLEEAFSCYEEGVRLVKSCSEKLDQVEKKIIVLQEGDAVDEG